VTLQSSDDVVVADVMTAMPDRDFAANRARGRIALAVAATSSVTRRRRVHESGSLRVRFPGPPAPELEAVIVNTAGGLTGGDAFAIDIAVEQDARLVVGTAAAEKIYRSLGPPATVDIAIKVDAGAALDWLPQETILFDQAALHRRIAVDLAETARLCLVESLVFGRTGMGEAVEQGRVSDCWRIRRNGRLIYAEGTRLSGDISRTLAEPAVADGGVAIATALVVPADAAAADAIHAISGEFRGEVGVSAWNGHALLRFCARDGAILRHDVARALAVLRAAPLPRLWIN